MDASFLNMLHDSTDNDSNAIGNGIDIQLCGIFKKVINQNGVLWRSVDRMRHVIIQAFAVIHDLHGPPP